MPTPIPGPMAERPYPMVPMLPAMSTLTSASCCRTDIGDVSHSCWVRWDWAGGSGGLVLPAGRPVRVWRVKRYVVGAGRWESVRREAVLWESDQWESANEP